MKLKPLNTSGIVTGFIGGAAMVWAGATWAIDPYNPSERWIGLAFLVIGIAIAGVCVLAFRAAVRRGRGEGGSA